LTTSMVIYNGPCNWIQEGSFTDHHVEKFPKKKSLPIPSSQSPIPSTSQLNFPPSSLSLCFVCKRLQFV
jgi:hypothetical protein